VAVAQKSKKKGQFDFGLLFSFFVLGISTIGSYFWFLIPVSVILMGSSKIKFIRDLYPAFFLLGLASLADWQSGVNEFEALGYIFYFLMGVLLLNFKRRNASYVKYTFKILFFSILSVLVLMLSSSYFIPNWSYEAWVGNQLTSSIFPYFFHAETWPELQRGVFDTILKPVLEQSLFAWFACMMGMAFFFNGAMEGLFARATPKNFKRSAKLWKEFDKWRAPDQVLIFLVLGMALVAASYLDVPEGELFALFGWNITFLACFPIFLQGVALMSFLMPRLPFFFLIAIFILLFLNWIAVLVLAGLGDLCFDFRSRMRSKPKSDSKPDEKNFW
jgi:hypothetical protein